MAEGFGLYIHWPYCTHICPYCDFNVYRERGRDTNGLLGAILSEIKAWHAATPDKLITSLYFGGGTPSLMEASQVGKIIALCEKLWGFAHDIEITLEANPNDGEIQKFSEFKAVGVERLSLGIQSFSDAALKHLGRFHSAEEAVKAAQLARKIFPRLSIDLIYARQNQSEDDWVRELQTAYKLDADHISPYGLTIEPNTAFEKKVARGAIIMPSETASARFYELTQDVLNDYGFEAYEISNHAKNNAAKSRHNLLYWQSKEWLGIGPGAHGRVNNGEGRRATSNIRNPKDYIDAINKCGFALVEDEILTQDAARDEYYLMGLRLEEGVIESEIYSPLNRAKAEEFANTGLINFTAGKINLTPKGRSLSNYIIANLLD